MYDQSALQRSNWARSQTLGHMEQFFREKGFAIYESDESSVPMQRKRYGTAPPAWRNIKPTLMKCQTEVVSDWVQHLETLHRHLRQSLQCNMRDRVKCNATVRMQLEVTIHTHKQQLGEWRTPLRSRCFRAQRPDAWRPFCKH